MTDDIKNCPLCGAATTLKTAKKGPNAGRIFHVCSRYPECKWKAPINIPKREPTLEDRAMYLLAFNPYTNVVLGYHTKDSSFIWLPAITTDGRLTFLPGGHQDEFDKLQEGIQERILIRDPEGKLKSWVCAAVSIHFPERPDEHYLITDVVGSARATAEIEHLYNSLASLRKAGDENWVKVTKYFSNDPAKSWINIFIEHLKSQLNWSEYVDKALQVRWDDVWKKQGSDNMGNDIGTRNKLALAIWRMGVQPRKNGNSYVILTFDYQKSFAMTILDFEPKIVTAREAACQFFSFVAPWELALPQQPRPAMKEVLRQLNPRDFLNPKMIPMAAIKPNRRDSIVCLCLEFQEGTTRIGLVLDDGRTAMASTNEVSFSSIGGLYTHVCEAFINEELSTETYHDALVSLMDSMKLKRCS